MNTRHLSFDEQRQRLALSCQLDRLNLRIALKPTPTEKLSLTILERLAPLVPHLPGRLGKWTRGIMKGTALARNVFEAMSG